MVRLLLKCDGIVSDSIKQAWLNPSTFVAELRVDPSSRCATLLLPKDSLAILPFYQSQADLDLMDVDQSVSRYSILLSPTPFAISNQVL